MRHNTPTPGHACTLDTLLFRTCRLHNHDPAHPRSRCDIAEMEWHHGVISQALTPLETGVRSYFVDDAVVVGKPEVAQVLKCAEQRWYPKYLTPEEQVDLTPSFPL